MSNNKGKNCLCLLALVASIQMGKASEAQSDTNLDEIIVTAQRRNEAIEHTPLAIAALNADALERLSIKTEADLQAAVPGLIATAAISGSQLTYAIRGQAVDSYTNSQPSVKPYFNEVPVPGLSSSSFYDLESIQVLKGPQGTLFGRNTTGGAVLYTPAAPKPDFGGYIDVRAGDYNRHGAEGAINIPLVGTEAILRVSGSFDRRDGFTTNTLTGETLGDVSRDSMRASLLLNPVDVLKNVLVVEYDRARGSGTPGVVYSVYAPGQTNNGIPLNSTAAFLFSPGGLNSLAGPGAWNAYLAAHPGVYPYGLASYAALQNQRGPYEVSLNENPTQDAKTSFLSNTTTWDLNGTTKIKNIFGFVLADYASVADQDGSPYLVEAGNYINIQKEYSEELQLLGDTFGGNLSYVGGIYYVKETNFSHDNPSLIDLAPIIPVTIVPYYSNLKDDSLAAYAQGTLALEPFTKVHGLSVTAGFRYTRENDEIDQLPGGSLYNLPGLSNVSESTTKKPSWLVGVEEQLNEQLLLYVTTRESFRSGGFNIFATPTPGTAAQGGNGFSPEVARDVEVGAKYRGEVISLPVRANVALYQETVDQVQRSLYAVNPVTQELNGFTANIPQAQVRGVEFDTSINPFKWLDVGFNVAYTNARFTKNSAEVFGVATQYGPYSDAPRWSGSVFAQLSQQLPSDIGTLTLRADTFTQSSFNFSSLGATSVPETDISAYTLVNMRVGLENIGGTHISLAGYVRNLTDRVYFVGGLPTGSVLGTNLAVPGDRRTVYGEAQYKF